MSDQISNIGGIFGILSLHALSPIPNNINVLVQIPFVFTKNVGISVHSWWNFCRFSWLQVGIYTPSPTRTCEFDHNYFSMDAVIMISDGVLASPSCPRNGSRQKQVWRLPQKHNAVVTSIWLQNTEIYQNIQSLVISNPSCIIPQWKQDPEQKMIRRLLLRHYENARPWNAPLHCTNPFNWLEQNLIFLIL